MSTVDELELSPEQEQELMQEVSQLEPVAEALEDPRTLGDSMEITNHGQIGRMLMPPGWVEVDTESPQGIGTRSSLVFKPIGEESARLCLFYRGLPISESDGSAFRNVLARGPRDLDEAEIRAISEVLGGKADPENFKFTSCRVECFRGRNVIVANGVYLRTKEHVLEIFIDTDGSGRVVQQIYFQAPAEVYPRYQEAASSAIKSIEWRE